MPDPIKINTSEISNVAMFTDIHWGARNNSLMHNTDNADYIEWFISKVKQENSSHIFFLGDWFENRNSINVLTLQMSYESLKKLNSLNIPIFLMIGNHDLYGRHNRDVHSIIQFGELSNVTIIDSNVVILNNDFVLCPFLFKDEYAKYGGIINAAKYVFGHFEFRNFILTGMKTVAEHGPDHSAFSKPKYIFSGHYHTRQIKDNVVYIGNVFPTNFGDAGDEARGCAFLNTKTEEVYFYDWDQAPCFFKTKLSDVVEGRWEPRAKARVRCLLDMEITYSEAQVLKEEFVKAFGLREFSIEENLTEKKDAVAGAEGGDEELLENLDLSSLKETVRGLLETGINNTTTINTTTLIQIWNEL